VKVSRIRTISVWISRDFLGLSGQGIGIWSFLNLFISTVEKLDILVLFLQYHYYRDQLLSFDEGEVDHLPMGPRRSR
jgi:hypothetical protein